MFIFNVEKFEDITILQEGILNPSQYPSLPCPCPPGDASNPGTARSHPKTGRYCDVYCDKCKKSYELTKTEARLNWHILNHSWGQHYDCRICKHCPARVTEVLNAKRQKQTEPTEALPYAELQR